MKGNEHETATTNSKAHQSCAKITGPAATIRGSEIDDSLHTLLTLRHMDLNQVTLPATDVAVSVEFYKQLGLRLIVDSVPRYARFECPEGNSTFSLEHSDNPVVAGAVIYFECEELDQVVAYLKLNGIKFDSDPVDQSWLWREARLRDPSGNPICLFYAGTNRKNPPWRLR